MMQDIVKAVLTCVGKPGQASSAAGMLCLAEFGTYHDLQMIPQVTYNLGFRE
jgi:hypothetical protein